MARKNTKGTLLYDRDNEKKLYRVKLTNGDSIIRLKNRMVVPNEEGYVIVHPEEYEQLKALKVC